VNESAVLFAPRAQRDLDRIALRSAKQIIADIAVLRTRPWPASKVKKLRGLEYWELKTGDYRTIFFVRPKQVVIVRIVNRRDLERTLGRIDMRALVEWIRNTLHSD
jgi:mRNA-degrading endonuclease RelE of RelBE toxin-antitoxin system